MDDNHFAADAGNGFIKLLDHEPSNGSHYVRAEHITAVRPVWDKDENWIGCDVYTLDGSVRRVNASFEQIVQAIDGVEAVSAIAKMPGLA